MAQPPGNDTSAFRARASNGPSTQKLARIFDTNSYGARTLVRSWACTRTPSPGPLPNSSTSAPSSCNTLASVRVSASRGVPRKITGWSVKRPATMSGRTAFLEPEIANVPCSGVPPSMRMRSILAIASRIWFLWSAGRFAAAQIGAQRFGQLFLACLACLGV